MMAAKIPNIVHGGRIMEAVKDYSNLAVKNYSNPASTRVYGGPRFYNAYKNTKMMDLTLSCVHADDCSFFLPCCVDISDILYTVSSVQNDETNKGRNFTFHFHIGHDDPCVLARNLLLLSILESIDLPNCADVDFLWAVWYEMEVSPGQLERLRRHLWILESGHIPRGVYILDESTWSSLKVIWKQWCQMNTPLKTLDLAQVRRSRKAFISACLRGTGDSIEQKELNDYVSFLGYLSIDILENIQLKAEIDFFCEYGRSSQSVGGMVNPSLLRPDNARYLLGLDIQPFTCYRVSEGGSDVLFRDQPRVKQCKFRLAELIIRWRQFQLNNNKIQISIYHGDPMVICTELALQFDFIHTSDMSDEMGLLNILISYGPLLKRPNGVLTTPSRNWEYYYDTIEEYIEDSIGCHPNLYPTILGLKLAESLELGTSVLHENEKSALLTQHIENDFLCKPHTTFGTLNMDIPRWKGFNFHMLKWVPVSEGIYKKVLDLEGDNNSLVTAIENVCGGCTRLACDKGHIPQSSLSVLTALRLVDRLKVISQVDDTVLLTMMQAKAVTWLHCPTVESYNPLEYTTRALAVMLGLERLSSKNDRLVEVEFNLGMEPTVPWVPMILFPVKNLMIVENIQDLGMLARENIPSTYGRIHVFQNLINKMDRDPPRLGFLILRSDLYKLNPESRMVLFSRGQPSVQAQHFVLASKLKVVREITTDNPKRHPEVHPQWSSMTQREEMSLYHLKGRFQFTDLCSPKDWAFRPVHLPTEYEIKFTSGEYAFVKFSCPVLPAYYFPSIENGTLEVSVAKDLRHSCGTLCLPWKKIDFEQIEQISFSNNRHILERKRRYISATEDVMDFREQGNANISPFAQMLYLIDVLHSVMQHSGRPNHCVVPVSLQGADGKSSKPCHEMSHLHLHIDGLFSLDGEEILKVTWTDVKADQMREVDFFPTKGMEIAGSCPTFLTPEGIDLVKNLLQTNTALTVQSRPDERLPCQHLTFIQLLFSRKRSSTRLPSAQPVEGYTRYSLSTPSPVDNAPRAVATHTTHFMYRDRSEDLAVGDLLFNPSFITLRPMEPTASGEQWMEIVDGSLSKLSNAGRKACQSKLDVGQDAGTQDSRKTRTSGNLLDTLAMDMSTDAKSNRGEEFQIARGKTCANCCKSDPKNWCSRCKTTSYCNKTCQAMYWPQHKELCSTYPITSMAKDKPQIPGENKLDSGHIRGTETKTDKDSRCRMQFDRPHVSDDTPTQASKCLTSGGIKSPAPSADTNQRFVSIEGMSDSTADDMCYNPVEFPVRRMKSTVSGEQRLEVVQGTLRTLNIGRRTCANCGRSGVKKLCSQCKVISYCNKTCQSEHWSHHKEQCVSKEKQTPYNAPHSVINWSPSDTSNTKTVCNEAEKFVPSTEANLAQTDVMMANGSVGLTDIKSDKQITEIDLKTKTTTIKLSKEVEPSTIDGISTGKYPGVCATNTETKTGAIDRESKETVSSYPTLDRRASSQSEPSEPTTNIWLPRATSTKIDHVLPTSECAPVVEEYSVMTDTSDKITLFLDSTKDDVPGRSGKSGPKERCHRCCILM